MSDRKFCLTGKLSKLTRAEAKSKIEGAGGKVVAAMSKNVDVLVAGSGTGMMHGFTMFSLFLCFMVVFTDMLGLIGLRTVIPCF